MASRIDYSPAVREELRVFVEEKAQTLGFRGSIHLNFEGTSGRLLHSRFDDFWALRFTIHINPGARSLFHHVNELKFALAHELGHFKDNPRMRLIFHKLLVVELKVRCVLIVTAVALLILQASPLFVVVSLLTAGVGEIALRNFLQERYFYWMRSMEERADRTACELCSPEERQGGIALFARIKDRSLAWRNAPNLTPEERRRRELAITPEGDKVDDYHPSNHDRIRFIQSYA